MDKLLLVMLGGAIGSGARWLVGVRVAARLSSAMPFGTLIVNVVGSFAMGIVAQAASGSASFTPERRAFVATGILGGFTTYSAFNQETIDFVNAGAWNSALIYAAVTAVLCLAAGFAGMATARAIAPS
jgi:CrcB protein